jgi:hypothetical protein
MLTPVYIGPRRYDHLKSEHQCGIIRDRGMFRDIIKRKCQYLTNYNSRWYFCRIHDRVYAKDVYGRICFWDDEGLYVHHGGHIYGIRKELTFPSYCMVVHPVSWRDLLIVFPRAPEIRLYRDLGGGLFQSETCEGEYVLWDVFQIEKVGVYLLRLPPLVTRHILSFLKRC